MSADLVGMRPPGAATAHGRLLAALERTRISRIEEVYQDAPQHPDRHDSEERDRGRPRRLAAVSAAYHASVHGTGDLLMFAWCRPDAGAPVTVLASSGTSLYPAVAGTLRVPATRGAEPNTGPVPLSFPPGCRGRSYGGDRTVALLASFPCWTRLGALVDGLLVDETAGDGDLRPGLVDGLLGVWHAPFAWLMVAEPVPPAGIKAAADAVAAQERDARSRTSSPEYAVRASRLELRHRELRAAESTGLWQIHLLVGGAGRAEVMAVAGLVAAAVDLTHLPYALVPGAPVGDLATVLDSPDPHRGAVEEPVLAGSPLVAALTRPPTVEIPGVRVIPRPTFDVTPETTAAAASVDLGEVMDRAGAPAGRIRLPMDSLNRHTFVCGATGAGKSQTIRHLLTQATRAEVPWLVIEPAKAEYRRMAARLPGHDVIAMRPGEPDHPPVGLNPLAPVPGFPLQTHADLTRALFNAAFQADEPFPQVLSAALTRSYEALGWDLTLGEPAHAGVCPRYPTLADLQAAAHQVIESVGYGREVTDNVRGFITVRLSSLRLGTTGRFFETGHRLDVGRLLRRNVVLEIEDIGDDRDKAFLMGSVLIQIVEHLRVEERRNPRAPRLRHLTVIEEAHRLLRRPDQPGPAAHAVELFAALLAEVRAYGEGLVIAEQIPAKLVPDVIKNTAVKIIHRLPAQDDRDAVGAASNLTDMQSRYLVTLPPGTAAVFADAMDHPILAVMPDGTSIEAGAEAGQPHPATTLIGAPLPGCPASCSVDPCDMRTMARAHRLLKKEPRIVAWAELAVIGHLGGMPAPTPIPAMRTALGEIEPRLLDCAVRHAVDAAVIARSAPLAHTHSPREFAAHVAAELRAQVAPVVKARCIDEPDRWLAGCFRWNLVHLALLDLNSQQPNAGRHPDSDVWETRYGQPITGVNCREQLESVGQWSLQLLADQSAVADVVYGIDSPSALETVVGQRRDAATWKESLAPMMAEFTSTRSWPEAFLAPYTSDNR
ncbi:ATP-binding protein [Polymorphospora sp. NPDC050346]|uniref:ATP-binding protein n=1 Tax=Polymorphospora sp. NPDC050346 TaxID=3155780 RepID=UPI0033D31C39